MLHLLMVGVTRLLIGQGKRNSEWMELIQKVVGLNDNSVFSFEFKPPLQSYFTVQPKRHKHNPRLRHGQIISPRRPNRVFTRRIAVALGIDPRNDAESVLTTRTFAE